MNGILEIYGLCDGSDCPQGSIDGALFIEHLQDRSAMFFLWQRPWAVSTWSGIILGMGSANERQRYNVTPSLISWAHTQNDPWKYRIFSIYGEHHYKGKTVIRPFYLYNRDSYQ